MALVVGTSTYATEAQLSSWASARGLIVPATEAGREALLVRALDLVEAYRARFQGEKTSSEQALQWPRSGVIIDGISVPSSAYPAELLAAQCALAYELQAQTYDAPVERETVREKVGDLEVQYAEGARRARSSRADALLAPLLARGGSYSAEVVRG